MRFSKITSRLEFGTTVAEASRQDHVMYDLSDREDEIAHQVVTAFELNKNSTDNKQLWKPVPFSHVQKIWNDYARWGFVRDTKGIDAIAKQTIDNFLQLYVNTVLAGHTQLDPKDYLEGIGVEWDDETLDKFADYIVDERGQWMISDQIDKLYKDIVDLAMADTEEQKLQVIDRIFNRVHARSDLAAYFIEGGSSSLNKLSSIDEDHLVISNE